MATVVSQSPASIASRNRFEPLAFVRSPMTRKDSSCSKGGSSVQRGGRRLVHRRPAGGLEVGARRHDLGEVLGRRAAAAADDRDPELADEHRQVLGERVGGQVVVHLAVDDRRQAGVGQRRDRRARLSGEVPQRLVHLDWAGRAVHADDVGLHRVEGAQGRADLGAEQHPAGELDRHLHLDRHLAAGVAHRTAAGLHRRLGLEQVVAGLDEEQVDSAFEQPAGEHLVGVAKVDEADLAEGRKLRARPHAAGDIARAVRRRVAARDLLRQPGRGEGELLGALRDLVLGEHDRQGAERVRLDDVDANLQERAVQLLDDVRAREAQHLVATLERLAAEVVGAELAQLQVGARRSVIDDDALACTVSR